MSEKILLKELIKDLIIENIIYDIEEYNIMVEKELLSIAESYEDNIDILVLSEGANLDNIKMFKECIKKSKVAIKQSKKLNKEGNKKEAAKLLDDAISNTKKCQKIIASNQGNLGSQLLGSLATVSLSLLPVLFSSVVAFIMNTNKLKEAEKRGIISNLKLKGGKYKFNYSIFNIVSTWELQDKIDETNAFSNLIGSTVSLFSLFNDLCQASRFAKKYGKADNGINVKIDTVLTATIKNLQIQKQAILADN